MSRIGRAPIAVPAGVEVKIDGSHISVKGPKGQLERDIVPSITVEQEGNVLHVKRATDNKLDRSLHGLTRTLIHNMVVGVTKGFEKSLIVNGVGYKVTLSGNKMTLNIGFSHPVEFTAPEGITFAQPQPLEIVVKGIDRQLVGQTAATIKAIKPVEPYHNYGIHYKDETVIHKVGKRATK